MNATHRAFQRRVAYRFEEIIDRRDIESLDSKVLVGRTKDDGRRASARDEFARQSHAVGPRHRYVEEDFTLGFRDVGELLAQRGVEIRYEAIRCWTMRAGPQIAWNLKSRRTTDVSVARGR